MNMRRTTHLPNLQQPAQHSHLHRPKGDGLGEDV